MQEVPSDPTLIAFLSKAAYAALAAFGGVAKHLTQYLRGEKFQLRQLVANTFTSGFSGYIFAEIALNLNPDWAFVAAGFGGYMGAQGMDFLFSLAQRWASRKVS